MLADSFIRLRKVEPADLPLLYAMENDTRYWYCSDTHNPLSQKDLLDYITSSTGDLFCDRQLRLMIESVEGETLGAVDLFDLDILNRKVEVGIYVVETARRCGVGTKTLLLLKDYVFNFLNMKQLYAFVPVNNIGSIVLFHKAGFAHTATLSAWVRNIDAAVFQLFA